MTETKRTPGPWEITGREATVEIKSHDGIMIADVWAIHVKPEVSEANAEFIVKACNSHDSLVRALKEISDKEKWGYLDDSGCPKGQGEYTNSWVGESNPIDIALEALRETDEVKP